MLETQCSSSSVLDNIADNAKNITFCITKLAHFLYIALVELDTYLYLSIIERGHVISFTPSFLLKRNHKCTKVIINLVPITNSLSLHCLVRFGQFDLNDCQQNKMCGIFSYYVYFPINFGFLQVSLDQSTLLKVEVIFFSHYILV